MRPPSRTRRQPTSCGSGRPLTAPSRVDPARAGWRYLSFRVERLGAGFRGSDRAAAGTRRSWSTFSVPRVELSVDDGPSSLLAGRASVFDGPPWFCYLPADRACDRPLARRRSNVRHGHRDRRGPGPPDDLLDRSSAAGHRSSDRSGSRSEALVTQRDTSVTSSRPNSRPTGSSSSRSSHQRATGRAGRLTSTTWTRCPARPCSRRSITTDSEA